MPRSGFVLQGSNVAVVAVIVKPSAHSFAQLGTGLEIVQVGGLVLERPPQPLDEEAARTIHADLDIVCR